MTDMSDERLNELLAKATPGPWKAGQQRVVERPINGPSGTPTVGNIYGESNATLIALAPTLASEVIALRAKLATQEDVMECLMEELLARREGHGAEFEENSRLIASEIDRLTAR